MVEYEDITPNKYPDSEASAYAPANPAGPRESLRFVQRERDSDKVVSIGRAQLDELIHAERCDDDQEFLATAVRIMCGQLGANAAVAVIRPPFDGGAAVIVPFQLDASLASSFLGDSDSLCDRLAGDVPSLVPLADDRAIEGTLLCGLLAQSGMVASLVYPLLRHECELIGSVRFFFEPSSIPQAKAVLAGRYVLCRMMLTLERIWLMRHSESTSAQLRAVFTGALDAMLLVSDQDIVISANPATHRMFGYPQGSIVGMGLERLLPEFGREEFARTRRLADGFLREVEGIRRDRTRFQGECSVSRVEFGGARVLIVRDVSDRRLAENRLREADRLAMIGTLAAGLGHDMNNVLFPIRAHINALEQLGSRAGVNRRRSHIVELRGGVCYLQHLADSLHYLAMDPEADSDDSASTDIGNWWTQTGPLLSKSLHRSATLEVVVAEGLPPIATPPHALTRAMLNLLVNAREAMPAARAARDCKVRIEARLAEQSDHVSVEVRDNGVGMTPETRRRAFELFYTTKPRGLGTGLGLPLVRSVVDRAGGMLEIDSIPSEGTVIRLLFPTAAIAQEDDAPKALLKGLDGRTTAIVGALLAKRGVEVVTEMPPSDCAICVVGADAVDARVLALWTRERPAGQIVVVGQLNLANMPFEVTAVGDSRDLHALESALEQALGSCYVPASHVTTIPLAASHLVAAQDDAIAPSSIPVSQA
jgi:PAS domain S-box-containing protein